MKIITIIVILSSLLVGCSYKNIPFQVEKEKEYLKKLRKNDIGIVCNKDSVNIFIKYKYKIRIGDELKMQATGIPLGEEQQELEEMEKVYKVNTEGNILLPMIGFVDVEGLTLIEASKKIEKEYEKFYKNPKVNLHFNNLRVFVYRGNSAQVVQLDRELTHLSEVMAMAGGLQQRYKLKYAKIIRGDKLDPVIIWIDLRREKNWEQLPLYVNADDVIYIQDRDIYYIMEEVRPYISIFSIIGSTAGIIYLFERFIR